MGGDAVDLVLAQWRAQRPELDVSPMGVVGRIHRAGAILDRAIHEVLVAHDLQPGEFDLLATLRRSGAPYELTVGDLLRRTMVTSGAVSHRLNRLDTKGLVVRHTDPGNRRSVLVTLTTAGLTVVERAVEAHVANERDRISSLTADEQMQLADLLRKLLLGLGDISENANSDKSTQLPSLTPD